MSANSLLLILLCLCVIGCTTTDRETYDRNIFNTSGVVTGTKPEKSYDPSSLGRLYTQRHETELKMFDVINEAALRRDKRMQSELDLYGDGLGYIPSLAARHYRYALGDTSHLDWLLAEDAKGGFGRDSLILTVFGYMDEWDKTIERFKAHEKVADGAGAAVLHNAMRIRKQLYGADKFEAAWARTQ